MTALAVIVVNFNGLKWIENCLSSVIQQKLPDDMNLEVVFVDNGSSDESAAFVKENFPSVSLIELDENLGFGSGCSLGISQTAAEFIVLLNNDTVLPVGTLSCLLEDLSTRHLDAVAAIEVPYDGGSPTLRRTTIDPTGFPIHLYQGERLSEMKSFYLSAVCLLFKRSTYDGSGGLDRSFFMYFEDIDWFWRLQLQGYEFDYAHHCTVRHAGHGSTGGHQLSYERFLWRNSNLPRMLIKNLRMANLMWIMPLYFAGYVVEFLALVVLGRRDLARSYVDAIEVIVGDVKGLRQSRRDVQRTRQVGDWQIFRRMYPGLAKLRGLRIRGFSFSDVTH